MKNALIIACLALTFVGCNSGHTDSEEVSTEESQATTDQKYSCPMHPEEIGTKGAECAQCGMELTEAVN